MRRSIVYLVGPDERNDQLRYSLRSLQNLPHDQVWIVGHKPRWVKGVQYLPVAQSASKHSNTWMNLEELGKNGPETFYLFNDDYFLLHPMAEIPVFHRGSLRERVAYYDRKPGLRNWAARGRHTMRAFEKAGRDPDSMFTYELHLPLPLEREQVSGAVAQLHAVRDIEPRFYMKRTWVANWANLGGQQSQDCKVHSKWGNATLRGSFLSTSDASWSGSTGAALRVRFPAPSPYEEKGAFNGSSPRTRRR